MINMLALCWWILLWILWHNSYFRWCVFHGVVGAFNYGIALWLHWSWETDVYTATTAGHMVHVYFGYFYDRDVSFRAMGLSKFQTMLRYWAIEGISFWSIIIAVYVVHTLAGYNVLFARGVVAMAVSSAISYGLNRWWTFARKTSGEAREGSYVDRNGEERLMSKTLFV